MFNPYLAWTSTVVDVPLLSLVRNCSLPKSLRGKWQLALCTIFRTPRCCSLGEVKTWGDRDS